MTNNNNRVLSVDHNCGLFYFFYQTCMFLFKVKKKNVSSQNGERPWFEMKDKYLNR